MVENLYEVILGPDKESSFILADMFASLPLLIYALLLLFAFAFVLVCVCVAANVSASKSSNVAALCVCTDALLMLICAASPTNAGMDKS
jgi:hypothetical protein